MTALLDQTLEALAHQVATSSARYAGPLISHLQKHEATLVLVRAAKITEAEEKREASD
jgi:hypothetical protein